MTMQNHDDSGIETLRAYHLGLTGSEYYGPAEEAHRAGRLVQRSMVLERDQLLALEALEREVARSSRSNLVQRVERLFRRVIGLVAPAADESANAGPGRLGQLAA